jgi:hypothetical protein
MPIFFIYCVFVQDTGRSTAKVLHCIAWMTWAGSIWKVGLNRIECWGLIWIYKINVSTGRRGIYPVSPTGLEPMLCTSEALMAQYLNVRHRKLGTFIIQTVHILQHYSAITG